MQLAPPPPILIQSEPWTDRLKTGPFTKGRFDRLGLASSKTSVAVHRIVEREMEEKQNAAARENAFHGVQNEHCLSLITSASRSRLGLLVYTRFIRRTPQYI